MCRSRRLDEFDVAFEAPVELVALPDGWDGIDVDGVPVL